MPKILDELRQEHQVLLAMLERDDILKVVEFVEMIHHPKEEQRLFPLIAQNPLLRQGGPRCTYFRGIELDFDIYANAQKLLQDFYQAGAPRAPEYDDFEWLKDGNPLNIPMYEHWLGHELAHGLRYLSQEPNSELYKKFFCLFAEEYTRLLRLHIEKEDTCLFVMANSILDSN